MLPFQTPAAVQRIKDLLTGKPEYVSIVILLKCLIPRFPPFLSRRVLKLVFDREAVMDSRTLWTTRRKKVLLEVISV